MNTFNSTDSQQGSQTRQLAHRRERTFEAYRFWSESYWSFGTTNNHAIVDARSSYIRRFDSLPFGRRWNLERFLAFFNSTQRGRSITSFVLWLTPRYRQLLARYAQQ